MLPFENRSRESDDAFFVDGIHDDILTQLSKVSALRVISRTSVEQFRDTKLPMKAIADQLGVTKILEGGVQRAGDRVRINVQLIDATLMRISGLRATIASSPPPTSSRSRARLQRDRWRAKGRADAGRAGRALQPSRRRSLEAWEAYQLGKQRLAKRTRRRRSLTQSGSSEGNRPRSQVCARIRRAGRHDAGCRSITAAVPSRTGSKRRRGSQRRP